MTAGKWIEELKKADPERELIVLLDNKTIIEKYHSGTFGYSLASLFANFQHLCNNIITEEGVGRIGSIR